MHRPRAPWPALLALLLLAAGTLHAAAAVPAEETAAPRPRVVVAVIDSGINLYHAEYRRAADLPPPPGMPPATPVHLALDAPTWSAARTEDHAELMAMQPRTLYAFPGTKIVAAISFLRPLQTWPLVLDVPGGAHGTMTTSRAVGNTVSIPGADEGVDLVLVQGIGAEALRWAAAQDWIDAISLSAGISPNGHLPVAPLLLDAGGIEAFQEAARAKPFFASSGNGVLNAGLAGFPSWMRGSSGAPDVVSVGANDNGRTTLWHNQDPYVVADGCANPAAQGDHLARVANHGGGTSSAAPFVAGGGARIVLEARRILGDVAVGPRRDDALPAPAGWDSLAPDDARVVLARGAPGLVPAGPLADGVFTLLDLKDVLYHTALAQGTQEASDGLACLPYHLVDAPVDEAPAAARFPFQGYGEVNAASVGQALRVLRGEADLPARPDEDLGYARAHATKAAIARLKE